MLKKIGVDRLRVGMYVHEVCGSWIQSPLWRKSMLLESADLIQDIQHSDIRQVIIDTSRGLDVDVVADVPEAAPAPQREEQAPVSQTTRRVSITDERARAARICAASKAAITEMFKQARMGNAVNVAEALPLVEEIAQSVMRNSDSLIALARLKTADDYTYMHSVAVCALMIALARQIGLDETAVHQAGIAGLMHDIGKMAVDMKVLNKPGALTDAEFEQIKGHPGAGYKMLKEVDGVDEATLDVCLHHHEKMDGSGYPKGLKGEQISLFARMGAICDVYDAVTSNRPYKAGWDPAQSLRKMSSWTGHFDAPLFQSFVKSVGIYPVGSLVKLESGRLAVVIEQAPQSLLLPRVRVFFSSKSMTYIPPQTFQLNAPGVQDKIASVEDPATWGFRDLEKWWLDAA